MTPSTAAGRALLERTGYMEAWHPVDGRRDSLTANIAAIEAEALAAVRAAVKGLLSGHPTANAVLMVDVLAAIDKVADTPAYRDGWDEMPYDRG